MGKEVKLGLALIGVLLVTFGGVLYWRLFCSSSTSNAPAPAAAQATADPDADASEQPTRMTASAELDAPQTTAGEDGGRWRDRFAQQAAATAPLDRAERAQSFLPDAADVSTPPGYGNPAAVPATPTDSSLSATQVAAPATADAPDAPLAGANTVDATASGAPYSAAGSLPVADPGNAVTAANAVADTPSTAPADVNADGGPGRFGPPRSVLRTASHDQYAVDSRGGYGAAPQDRYGSDAGGRSEPAVQPAGLPAGPSRPAAMARGYAEPEDPAVDPRARFAPGAYAGPGAGAPTAAEAGKYVVQPNDNYWTVSEKVYGTGAFFKALREHNRTDHPKSDRLQVGDVLAVPPVATLHRQYPDLCPKARHVRAASQMQAVAASPRQRLGAKVYVVEQGDTLFDIARYKLGKASRWAEIYELNRDTLGEDFDYLRPGTELVMPTSPEDRGDSLTRQRDDSLQR